MLPEFRAAVFLCEGAASRELENAKQSANESAAGGGLTDEELAAARERLADSIPRQLQLLFARLQLSSRRAVCDGRCTLLCGTFDWDLPRKRLVLSPKY